MTSHVVAAAARCVQITPSNKPNPPHMNTFANFHPLSRELLIHGTVLFLFGLLNGLAIQRFRNPRMGLSAHLTALQNGIVLWAFGLMWPNLALGMTAQHFLARAAIAAMYAIWLALLLAAVLGTSRSTPLAGAGHAASRPKELLVTALLVSGALAILVSTSGLLWGLLLLDPKPM